MLRKIALLPKFIKNKFFKILRKIVGCKGFFDAPGLKEDDVFLASFPRSGNTWVRVIIANILYDNQIENMSLDDINLLVPAVVKNLKGKKGWSSPRVIKTHRSFGLRHEKHRSELYKKNIYICRNPIDTIMSYYDYQYNLWGENRIEDIDEFALMVSSGSIGAYSWQEHVLSWKAMENKLDILFIKYEDLQREPIVYIKKIAGFLGKEINDEKAIQVNEKSSLKTMREMEARKSVVENKDYSFIRKDEEKRKIEKSISDEVKKIVYRNSKVAMDMFGYDAK